MLPGIQLAVGDDLFALETMRPYAVSYDGCIAEAKAELQENARPELSLAKVWRYWAAGQPILKNRQTSGQSK